MCIVNILKPYERVYRKPINTYTSFCIAKLTPAELKKKYNRNGKISLTEFGKMVQENNHAQLRKSGIVITAKEINEPIYKNGTSAMWWAVYYSNVELARIFL